MGRYLREARHHAEKIEYYYNHAGTAGYSQAVYHWDKLSDLMVRAMRSKNDKSDAPVIRGIIDSSQTLMDEMKAAANDDGTS